MKRRPRKKPRKASLKGVPAADPLGPAADAVLPDPYREAWLLLTPAERLRRAWRLRSRIKDPEAVHDAKTYPRL